MLLLLDPIRVCRRTCVDGGGGIIIQKTGRHEGRPEEKESVVRVWVLAADAPIILAQQVILVRNVKY